MPTASQQAIEDLTCSVLSRMNDDLPASERFTPDPELAIMGDGGVLDSLGIANFIVGMEEAIEGSFGTSLDLSDQDLMGLFETATVTVKSFAAFVFNRINS